MFSNRVIDEWNMLNDDIVSCNTVDVFKAKLDQYLSVVGGLYKSLTFFPQTNEQDQVGHQLNSVKFSQLRGIFSLYHT